MTGSLDSSEHSTSAATTPAWRPLNRVQRRIVGVLVEKAKTTPDAYPMTLNALTAGCNQKSNRFPQMELESSQVEEVMEGMREMGAVMEVSGGGRVPKYKHRLYEWLGVDKVELAVMAELLLRGAQTVGELRGRAARMEPIPDLSGLKPVLDSLKAKNLVCELSPAGRGQVVSHNLYSKDELDKLRQEFSSPSAPARDEDTDDSPAPRAGVVRAPSAEVTFLQAEIESLREEVSRLRKEIDNLWASIG